VSSGDYSGPAGPPEGKARQGARKQHTLTNDCIPTIEGKSAIRYPHPKRLSEILEQNDVSRCILASFWHPLEDGTFIELEQVWIGAWRVSTLMQL